MFSNTLQSVSSIQASFPRHIPKATAVLSKLNLVQAATTTAITPIYLIVIGINTTPRLGLPWRLAWNRASKYTVSAPVLSQFMIEMMFYPVNSADGIVWKGSRSKKSPNLYTEIKVESTHDCHIVSLVSDPRDRSSGVWPSVRWSLDSNSSYSAETQFWNPFWNIVFKYDDKSQVKTRCKHPRFGEYPRPLT